MDAACSCVTCCVGFLEKEIRKDGIPMLDTGENPDAPAPREMIDLEVSPRDTTSCTAAAAVVIVVSLTK